MSNRLGTRWRGKIPQPKHCHPLVRRLIDLMNTDRTTTAEVAYRAGFRPRTVSCWRYNRMPRLDNFEAALNVLGYRLAIEPIPEEPGVSRSAREAA